MKLHITKGSGKLEGINNISVSTLKNPFCQRMQKIKGSVCSKCYASRLEKLRPNLERALMRNTKMLTQSLLPDRDIPLINAVYFRFNSFGELYNDIHYQNLVLIAKKNPRTTFVLWTKRMDIVNKYPRQENIVYVLSHSHINISSGYAFETYSSPDHTFTVYDNKHIADDNVQINCEKKCIDCLKCYQKGGVYRIREKLK